jgi:hypothetical protein
MSAAITKVARVELPYPPATQMFCLLLSKKPYGSASEKYTRISASIAIREGNQYIVWGQLSEDTPTTPQ